MIRVFPIMLFLVRVLFAIVNRLGSVRLRLRLFGLDLVTLWEIRLRFLLVANSSVLFLYDVHRSLGTRLLLMSLLVCLIVTLFNTLLMKRLVLSMNMVRFLLLLFMTPVLLYNVIILLSHRWPDGDTLVVPAH